ncbi:hypothetical protein V8E53_008305 [Lactarius tabidus]
MSDHRDSESERYIHLKEISVDFIKRRPKSALELVFKDDTKDDARVKHESNKFKKGDLVLWNIDMYVRTYSTATLTIRRALFKTRVARISVEFKLNEFVDDSAVGLEDSNHRISVNFVCGKSRSLAHVAVILKSPAFIDLAPIVPRFLKLSQLAAQDLPLPPPTSERGYNVPRPYTAINWLDGDILLSIFNCYRLDDENHWNFRLRWCKLSHVCQKWRHLIYEWAFYLGMHIECTNGTPIVDRLDHLPPLPLFVSYRHTTPDIPILPEQDELGIYHALCLHDRVRHIDLDLPPSILHKALVLMNEHFPILEHISLSFSAQNSIPFTLPKAFLAPNLRYLAFPGVSPAKRLRFLTSMVSLVTLKLTNIETSSYFRPRVLVARLESLPQLQDLFIHFSIPIPRPSTERELLGEPRAPVTLPGLKNLLFKGVGAYLESLIAQIGTCTTSSILQKRPSSPRRWFYSVMMVSS